MSISITDSIEDAVKNPDIMVVIAVGVMFGIKKYALIDLFPAEFWYGAIAVGVIFLTKKDGKLPFAAGLYAAGFSFLMDIPHIGVPLLVVAIISYFLLSVLRGIEEEKGFTSALIIAFLCAMMTGPMASKILSNTEMSLSGDPSEWNIGLPRGI
jgi:hypothetical protein